DFKKATELFADPAFDGDPVQVYEPKPDEPPIPPDDETAEGSDAPEEPPEPELPDEQGDGGASPAGAMPLPPPSRRGKYVVKDVPVWVVAERVQYYDKDGRLITESLKDYSKKSVRAQFASLDQFLTRWNAAERKQAILDELENAGVLLDALAAEVGHNF